MMIVDHLVFGVEYLTKGAQLLRERLASTLTGPPKIHHWQDP
jgi:hypothetical protein